MRKHAAALLLLVLLAYAVLFLHDRPPATPGAWLAALGLQERYATIAGHRVRYVRAGRGPAVLLLHGFASSIYTWRDVIPALLPHHEVAALDLPGFGGSDRPADLSFELYPRVVRGFLDELGWERASLAGNSMGGAVAALVAGESPTRVDRLVLLDAAGFNFRAADRPMLVNLTVHPLAERVLLLLPLKRLVVGAGLRQVFHDDSKVTRERVDEYLAGASRPGTLAAIRSLGSSLGLAPEAFAASLREVTAPTLVIWGEKDTWIPPAHADLFLAAIPGARKVVLAGVGHTPEEEAPSEVSRLLLEFLVPARSPVGR